MAIITPSSTGTSGTRARRRPLRFALSIRFLLLSAAFVLRLLTGLLLLLLAFGTAMYLKASMYRFPQQQPFSGDVIINPYFDLDAAHWRPANFHAHAKSWLGLTNGEGTDGELIEAYRLLGYDIANVSNYQRIDTTLSTLPVYEHGYGVMKFHQLVIGGRDITRVDFPFFTNRHYGQSLIDLQRKENQDAVIAIAHPALRGACSFETMRDLSGYDCIEVLNPSRRSFAHWDTALSCGHPVFIVANDDTHDQHSCPRHFGRLLTPVNVDTVDETNILAALRNGRTIGARTNIPDSITSLEERRTYLDKLERIRRIDFDGRFLTVEANAEADTIRFNGQNGTVRCVATNSTIAVCPMEESDTYLRAEIHFAGSGNRFYLNPVYRRPANLPAPKRPVVDVPRTTAHHTVVLAALAVLLMSIRRLFRRRHPSAG